MKTYYVKYRTNTENLNSKNFKTKNDRLIMQSKCTGCAIKKSRFLKAQEAKGLLSNLGIKNHWRKFHCWIFYFALKCIKMNKIVNKFLLAGDKGAYIKYVGGGREGFTKFFKKNFVAQETIDLNTSWPSNFFRKYFMAPPINFSFSFKVYLQQYFRVVLTVIFKFQITKDVTFTIILKKKHSNEVSKKALIFFAIWKFFYSNKKKFQENSSSSLQ